MITIGRILVNRSVVDSILTYAKLQHPREGILLLRGAVDNSEAHFKEVVIPPLAIRGYSYSAFPLHMLPIDLSIIGTAHSHPSGVLQPSIEDLNHFYGRIMIITAYPYESEENLAIFERDGKLVKYDFVEAHG